MNASPGRPRLPLLVGVAALIGVVVVGAILFVPGLLPGPEPTESSSVEPTTSSSADTSPESATQAFFAAFADGRRTGDATVVEPFVTGDGSSAFLTVDAFLRGQTEAGKTSITTVLRMENFQTSVDGDIAIVELDYTEGGYDIDLNSGEPLESPVVLPTRHVTVELRLIEGTWLVDSFETAL